MFGWLVRRPTATPDGWVRVVPATLHSNAIILSTDRHDVGLTWIRSQLRWFPLRNYFPHFLDAEYSNSLGARRAARIVDQNLKLLALLGARISAGGTVLVDSEGVQRLVADEDFLSFVKNTDRRFLRLEVDGDPGRCDRDDREWAARHAWRRMQITGWVSSSSIGTPAMVAAADAALDTGFDDKLERERFKARLDIISRRFELSKEANSALLGTFDLLSWYGSSSLAVARVKNTSPITYYDKLVEALQAPQVPEYESDYQALNRVKKYIDNNLENRWARSAVLVALAADSTSGPSAKDEIRTTVGSAWTAAMAVGTSATVNLTLPLPAGVTVPRVFEKPDGAFVRYREVDNLIRSNPFLRVQETLRVNVAHLTWQKVGKLVKATEDTREPITEALDTGGEVANYLIEEHSKALNDQIKKHYPAVAKRDAATLAISVASAVQSHNFPVGYLAVGAAGVTAGNSMWRWTRGRFLAGTVNRLIGRLRVNGGETGDCI